MMRAFIYLLLLLTFASSCRHDADQFSVKGIDVSHYQKKIDWKRVGQQQLDFVFMKATEGMDYQDSTFERNWAASKETNLIRGAYHFFRPNMSVEWQAKNFIRTVKLEKGDFPPVLDVEDLKDEELPKVATKMRTWLALIESHYGIKPIIYTNLHLYQKHFQEAFPDYHFWIARYNNSLPPLGETGIFWQYSDEGSVRGIQGDVDLNIFVGNKQQLQGLVIP